MTQMRLNEDNKKRRHFRWKTYLEAPSLSELTPTIFNMGLTHLGLETSILLWFYKSLLI